MYIGEYLKTCTCTWTITMGQSGASCVLQLQERGLSFIASSIQKLPLIQYAFWQDEFFFQYVIIVDVVIVDGLGLLLSQSSCLETIERGYIAFT